MVFVILGAVLIAIGVVLLVVRIFQQRRLAAIQSAEPATAQQLAQAAEQARGNGPFRRLVELNGLIRCDSALTGEVSGQPCAYYDMTVTREYEETYYETDSQTERQVEKTRRSSDTVASNSQRVEFWVEDETGAIPVNPTGASIDAVQVVDRFEPGEVNFGGGVIAIGGFSLAVGGFGFREGPGTRTLGYHFKERILPLDRRAYVLGEASDSSGRLAVQQPSERGKTFLISLKTEEELLRSTERAVQWLLYGAIGCGAAGIALVVLGLLKFK